MKYILEEKQTQTQTQTQTQNSYRLVLSDMYDTNSSKVVLLSMDKSFISINGINDESTSGREKDYKNDYEQVDYLCEKEDILYESLSLDKDFFLSFLKKMNWNGKCDFISHNTNTLFDLGLSIRLIASQLWDGKKGLFFEKFLDSKFFCELVVKTENWEGDASWLEALLSNEENFESVIYSKKWNGNLSCLAHQTWFLENENMGLVTKLMSVKSKWNGDFRLINENLKNSKPFVRELINSNKWDGVFCDSIFPLSVLEDYDICLKIVTHKKWNGYLPCLAPKASKSKEFLTICLENEFFAENPCYDLFDCSTVKELEEELKNY